MSSIVRLFRSSVKSGLGPLERQLLKILWQRESATVREVVEHGDVKLAYTTVMTTLDRLYKKRYLDRVPEGRAFRYSPRYTQEELEKAAAGEVIRQLLASDSASALPLSYLVEAVSAHDVSLLDQLQELLEKKRRELQAKENS